MEKEIYVIITTKDRSNLLEDALESVLSQSYKPKKIIVVSDSKKEEIKKEQNYIKNISEKVKYISNKRSKCYGGSLNTAIDYLMNTEEFKFLLNSYIAILDDDDIWEKDHLKDCIESLDKEYDFLIPGIKLFKDKDHINLSIPKKLNFKSFLGKNPHIQGSNTFIKFETLLEAGCFDENIVSTTDRELFTRVMLLGKEYKSLTSHRVHFNCDKERERISTNKNKKLDGLSNFYYKYNGFFTRKIEEDFIKNSEKFGISMDNIKSQLDKDRIKIEPIYNGKKSKFNNSKLTIGVVATYELVDKLIEDIEKISKNRNIEVIIIDNFKNMNISKKYNEILKKYSFVKIITKNILRENASKMIYGDEIRCHLANNRDYIKDIAVVRTILFYHLYKIDSDIYWILDDDMRLSYITLTDNGYEQIKFDIFDYLETIDTSECDALIGKYTKDSPIPMLFSLRSQLVDYFYNYFNDKKKFLYNTKILSNTDFYHDLSRYNIYNETPVYTKKIGTLENIFSGIQEYRKLHSSIPETNSTISCGGNILIFNKEILKVENKSLILDGLYGRRGDSLWRIMAQKGYGYKIENGNFSTLHSRGVSKFEILQEIEKVKKDIIGHAFINSLNIYIKEKISLDRTVNLYFEILWDRVNGFILQFYRIKGLIKTIDQQIEKIEYLKEFEKYQLSDFIDYFNNIKKEEVEYELNSMIKDYNLSKNKKEDKIFKQFISENFNIKKDMIDILGRGSEGIVFTDRIDVYKVFYKKNDKKIYRNNFIDSKHVYLIEVINLKYDVIKYRYEDSKPYIGGDLQGMIEILQDMYKKKYIYANLTKSNLIVVGNTIKIIDYGRSFIEFTEEAFEKTMKKAYLLSRYPNLCEREFKKISKKFIKNQEDVLLVGYKEFRLGVLNRHHVEIHDTIVYDYVKDKEWDSLMDYGAGKCQISNKFKKNFPDKKVYAYDILMKQLEERSKDLEIVKDIDSFSKKSMDYTLCNIVLSTIDFKICDEILSQINRIGKDNSKVLLSITNPFFTNNISTEIKISSETIDLYKNTKLRKKVRSTSRYREDYYKTLDSYKYLFRRNGFKIINIFESDGVDLNEIMPNSDFLYFELEKISDISLLEEVSLLIKTNPMEYRTIKKQVESIVMELELGCKFKEKILLVDDFENIPNRQYDDKDREFYYRKLKILCDNKKIDRVINTSKDIKKIDEIYKKYFNLESKSTHSSNGQQLFTTLYGFEGIKTDLVLQVDSDIILRIDKRRWLDKAIEQLKTENCLTISLNIPKKIEENMFYGKNNRVEVRGSLIDLKKLKKILPLENKVKDDVISLSWHRSLDKYIENSELYSMRGSDNSFYFIHPENKMKCDNDSYNKIIDYNTLRYPLPTSQYENVNIINNKDIWKLKNYDEVVILSRGRNTSMNRLKRFFDSLEAQNYLDFRLIYIDDYSDNYTEEYARYRCEYFKGLRKPIYIRNYENKKTIKNLFLGMEIIKNNNAIVIHIDNDDCLVGNNAVEIILKKFKEGHDVTIGNCVRADKPMKNYLYYCKDLKKLHYTNYWIHPKAHIRSLFNKISWEDFIYKNQVYEINSDIIMMKKIIEESNNPGFIEEKIYCFDPSVENKEEKNEYDRELKEEIKLFLE